MLRSDMLIGLSSHAYDRVATRLSLSAGQLIKLIREDKTLSVGYEPGTQRNHLLFFSEHDNQCFVVILDENDGTVITILPMDYHANVSWHVDQYAQDEARKLVLGAAAVPPRPVARKLLVNLNGGTGGAGTVTTRLGHVVHYGEVSRDGLLQNEQFVDWVVEQVKAQPITPLNVRVNATDGRGVTLQMVDIYAHA